MATGHDVHAAAVANHQTIPLQAVVVVRYVASSHNYSNTSFDRAAACL